MDHSFPKTIRSYIFFARLHMTGSLIWLPAIWSQNLDWRRYFPDIAYTAFHIVPMIGAAVIGLSLQLYCALKLAKIIKRPGVKAWSTSLAETKRRLNICYLALGSVFFCILCLILAGVNKHNVIDYQLALISALFIPVVVACLSELAIPHAMPVLQTTRASELLVDDLSC